MITNLRMDLFEALVRSVPSALLGVCPHTGVVPDSYVTSYTTQTEPMLLKISFTAGLVTFFTLSIASPGQGQGVTVCCSGSKSSIRRFVITEKAPTRTFSWLKEGPSRGLLRDYEPSDGAFLKHYSAHYLGEINETPGDLMNMNMNL